MSLIGTNKVRRFILDLEDPREILNVDKYFYSVNYAFRSVLFSDSKEFAKAYDMTVRRPDIDLLLVFKEGKLIDFIDGKRIYWRE